MACNTCHPHPPIDWGNFGYSELYVAVNTAFYQAREAVEKYAKAKWVDDGPPGTIPQLPEVVPTEANGNGAKFIAEDGGFGGSLGSWEALIAGGSDYGNQFYAARLGYAVNDNCKLYLGYNHTGAGSNSDVFGVPNSGTNAMIPGAYTDGYWQNDRGGAYYVDGYFDDAVLVHLPTDTFFIECSYSF